MFRPVRDAKATISDQLSVPQLSLSAVNVSSTVKVEMASANHASNEHRWRAVHFVRTVPRGDLRRRAAAIAMRSTTQCYLQFCRHDCVCLCQLQPLGDVYDTARDTVAYLSVSNNLD